MFSAHNNDFPNRDALWKMWSIGRIKECVISLCRSHAASSPFIVSSWWSQKLIFMSKASHDVGKIPTLQAVLPEMNRSAGMPHTIVRAPLHLGIL